MSISYRKLNPGEEDAVMDLWVSVFGDTRAAREQIYHDFNRDLHRPSRAFVAMDQDGNLVAAAAYWLRFIRDAQGSPQKTGHVWGVATRPDSRRQGHAAQLLGLAIYSMREEGCVWSILFAEDEAQSLYSGLGWQLLPARFLGGLLSDSTIPSADIITVRTFDPPVEPTGWEPIARVYSAFNASRPLSQVRDTLYWGGYIHWMYTDWHLHHHATILVAGKKTAEADVCGYALVHFYDEEYTRANFNSPPWFYISELGALENDPEVIHSLLIAIAAQAKDKGLGYGQMALPNEPWILQAFERVFTSPLEAMENEGTTMIKALSPEMESSLADAITAPKAFVWEIDRF